MTLFLISFVVSVIWVISGRLSYIREKDYRLWRYSLSLGPYKAWEEDKYMMGFIFYLLGPISLLIVYSMNKVSSEDIKDTLSAKKIFSDRSKSYEKNIEKPYYKKYKINPCSYCEKVACEGIFGYCPCNDFIQEKIETRIHKSCF